MMIEIDLSQNAIDKIVALGKLTGRDPREVSQIISGMVENSLDNLGSVVEQVLIGASGIESSPRTIPRSRLPLESVDGGNRLRGDTPHPTNPPTYNQDTTGISDGLGDEDEDAEEIQGETDPEALVPTVATPSDEELANELNVSEPEIEAAAEATFSDDIMTTVPAEAQDAERVFGDMLGSQVPDADFYGDPPPPDDPRVLKKAGRRKRSRGKVVPLNHDPAL